MALDRGISEFTANHIIFHAFPTIFNHGVITTHPPDGVRDSDSGVGNNGTKGLPRAAGEITEFILRAVNFSNPIKESRRGVVVIEEFASGAPDRMTIAQRFFVSREVTLEPLA